MAVGLDIGTKTIKLVELIKDGDAWKLNSSGVLGYNGKAPELVEDDKDLAPIAEAVRKLHKEARVSSKDVALSIPEPLAYTRMIKFPLMTDDEIASAVKWEAEQYIPIPANEAIIQHTIVGRNEELTPPEVSVLLVAAPKKIVAKYVKAVEMAGLNVFAVETDLVALTRAIAPAEGTVLIVDIGASSTDIAIAKDGILVFSRSISTAGEAFTRAITQTLAIQPQQAEEYKRTYGLSDKLEGKIKAALSPVFRVVADEIRKSMHFYQSEERGDQPRSAILSGGTSQIPEITSALTELLSLEVVVGNPFAKIAVDPEAQQTLANYAPLYSIACGLGMRQI